MVFPLCFLQAAGCAQGPSSTIGFLLRSCSHLLVQTPNAHTSQGWERLRPAAQTSSRVSQVGQGPNHHHLLPPTGRASRSRNREPRCPRRVVRAAQHQT